MTLAGTAAWLIVLVSPAWNQNERGWHDKAAGTIVINDPHPDHIDANSGPADCLHCKPGLRK